MSAAATFTNEAMKRAPLPQRPRVLVVDDNRDAVLTLTTLLEDEGFEARGVYHAEHVLPLARNFRPDAFILDIAMPGQSGYSLARDIRRSYYTQRAPLLIALTGEYKRPADALLSRAAGFDHHLTKPYDPVALMQLLKPLTLPDDSTPDA
ncbi:MAG: response regulator [Betaproteobacteria bacterium]